LNKHLNQLLPKRVLAITRQRLLAVTIGLGTALTQLIVLAIVPAPGSCAYAAGNFSPVDDVSKTHNDVIFNALGDEMDRSFKNLKLGHHQAPYFVRYTVYEADELDVSSSLGAPPNIEKFRTRYIDPDLRVGSYDLDNTNFLPTENRRMEWVDTVTVDDDYTALRRSTWLKSDEAYKGAIEDLETKIAYLRGHPVHNRLPDFVKIKPVVSVGDTARLTVDEAKWKAAVQKLSAIFKNYPKLQRSCVVFKSRQINRWLLTSEGTKIRDTQSKYLLHMMVTAQADDGMSLSDWEVVGAPLEKQLPDFEKLESIAKEMAERMSKLCAAPKGEDYCGPVMFEGQAAGEFLYTLLGPNISMAEEIIGQNSDQNYFEHWRNPLKDTMGRRILPKYVNLIDDPSLKEFNGTPLLGGYKYDDDGVQGQAITIAENGLLKAFCQGRVPTKYFAESNGHCFRGRSAPSILHLVSTQTNSPPAMKQKLIDLGKDAGLKYVLIVRKLNDNYQLNENPPTNNPRSLERRDNPSYTRKPGMPSLVYRVNVDDGSEELERGLEFKDVSLRAFRDIQAVGDDPAPQFLQPWGEVLKHVISPSYIVGEMELTTQNAEHASPPELPSPLADSK
jgi:TldD protein